MDQTFDQLHERRSVTFTHEYSFTVRRLAWWTLAITSAMGALYFLVGFPPAFDTFYEKMYFHAIGIGLAALAAYLVIDVFELEAHEPPLDFPMRYRAFVSVVFAALGGLVYLNRDVFASLPDVGVLFFVIAFVVIFDVGAALLIELIVLPRKKAGIYDSRSRNLLDYVGRLVPFTAADRAAYSGVGSGYWLAVASIASACLAMVIGFINLWVHMFGNLCSGRPSSAAGWPGSGSTPRGSRMRRSTRTLTWSPWQSSGSSWPWRRCVSASWSAARSGAGRWPELAPGSRSSASCSRASFWAPWRS